MRFKVYYGDEKKKQMARSILPSTRSGWARFEQRRINKQNRQKVRRELQKALYDEEYQYEGDFYAEPDWGYYVRERQEGDKLNPFMRWAEEITKDLPRDERLSKVRAILPDNLIGWHAVSHLEFREHFMTEAELNGHRYFWRRDRKPVDKKARQKAAQERRVHLLTQIVEDNRIHRLFNRWMVFHHQTVQWLVGYTEKTQLRPPCSKWDRNRKQFMATHKPVGPDAPRLLGGMGDIEDFISDLMEARHKGQVEVEPFLKREIQNCHWYWKENKPANPPTYIWEHVRRYQTHPDHHPEWWRAMADFLDLFEKSQGDYGDISDILGRKGVL